MASSRTLSAEIAGRARCPTGRFRSIVSRSDAGIRGKGRRPRETAFTLSSPAAGNGQLLPEYRCEPKVDGIEASIPLAWSGTPEGTGSLAIVGTATLTFTDTTP